MTSTRVFNDSVFDSYANLKYFFDRSNAVEQVLTHKNEVFSRPLNPLNPKLEVFSRPLNPLNPKLAGKWQVCQIATAPFRWILAIVLDIIAKIPALFGAQHLSERLANSAMHLKIGFNVFSENTTHLFRIANSINDPNREGRIVFESSPIPESRITDPKVKSRTFCQLIHEVRFNHSDGICRGESNWFLKLYLETKSQFSDPRTHMAALGQQFAGGGGMEPTLLQSLHIKKGKLLGLKIGTQPEHSRRSLATPLIQKTPEEWKNSAQELSIQLQNLPVGAYGTGLPRHRTSFVKINPTLSFFFDPNHGITEINGPEQGGSLYKIITKTLHEICVPNSSPLCHLYISPVTLRSRG